MLSRLDRIIEEVLYKLLTSFQSLVTICLDGIVVGARRFCSITEVHDCGIIPFPSTGASFSISCRYSFCGEGG